MTKSEAINVVLGIAEEEIGYLERKITASLTARLEMPDQQTMDKILRDIKPSHQGQPGAQRLSPGVS